MKPLNPTAQKVQDILLGLGTDSKVVEFTESTRTAQEAADRGKGYSKALVDKAVSRGKSTQEKADELLGRQHFRLRLEHPQPESFRLQLRLGARGSGRLAQRLQLSPVHDHLDRVRNQG